MKKLSLAVLLSASLTMTNAQDCKNFLYMTNNAQVQITVYDKKGKESGVQTWKISDVKKDGNGFASTINTSFKDEKGKEIAKSSGTYKCAGGALMADIRMSMPQEQMQAYKNNEAKIEAVYLEYPYNINVGQNLKDAEIKMDMNSDKGMATTVNFKQHNRVVNGKEKVTTPAGTWDAYIINYDANFKTQIAGIGIPFNFRVKEWFVPGTGIVKSETYSANGKLIGSTLMTSITR